MYDETIIFACDSARTITHLEDQDKRQLRIAAIFQDARRLGLCPVSLIVANALGMVSGIQGDVPAATSKEGEMARMLVLANYAQRVFAVGVMEALLFKDYAKQLAEQPLIVDRDGLPPAQVALSEMLDHVRRRLLSEGYDEGQRARFYCAQAVLRGLRGAYAELDGYVPNIPVIMTRFTHLLAIADAKIDKEALWNKLCAAA